MVIGIDISRANQQERTGVEQYAWHLVQAFKTIASTASIVLYSPLPPIPEWGPFPSSWQWKRLRLPGGRLWTQIRLSTELLINTPDVFFAPCSGLPIITSERTVATVHDVAFLTHPHLYPPGERALQRWYLERIVAVANTIIVPTVATNNTLLSYYPQCKRSLVVVPHGAFGHPRDGLITKEPNTILFVGRIEKKKNITALIDAVESLAHDHGYSSLSLQLVGKPGYGFSEIQPFIERCARHIRWHGWMNEDALRPLRELSLILALPSITEGFGFPILEAWQYGSIPIISPCPALQEVGGKAVVVSSSWSPRDLAQAIQTILDNPQRASQLQQLGREALRRFRWNDCARTTFDILSGSYAYSQ